MPSDEWYIKLEAMMHPIVGIKGLREVFKISLKEAKDWHDAEKPVHLPYGPFSYEEASLAVATLNDSFGVTASATLYRTKADEPPARTAWDRLMEDD